LHEIPQMPPVQTAVAFGGEGQVLSQAPQRVTSESRSKHRPSQSTKPPPQVMPQMPPSQSDVPFATVGHPSPQAPQFDGSAWVSTQEPLQAVSPSPQSDTHSPARQALEAAQTVPQAPQ
jgi:hypothetical protein